MMPTGCYSTDAPKGYSRLAAKAFPEFDFYAERAGGRVDAPGSFSRRKRAVNAYCAVAESGDNPTNLGAEERAVDSAPPRVAQLPLALEETVSQAGEGKRKRSVAVP